MITLLIALIILPLYTPGNSPKIKTITVKEGRHLRLLQNFAQNGDLIFEKNDSMNGPVIMISGYEYDTRHRKTRFIYAHSNVGYSISDYVYEANVIKQYDYTTDTLTPDIQAPDNDSSVVVGRQTFNPFIAVENINSLSDLQHAPAILKLLKARRFLQKISNTDAHNNIVRDVFFNFKGDTTDIGYHFFNAKNQETEVHWINKTGQDTMYEHNNFDSAGNLEKWSQIFVRGGQNDTSQINIYTFSPSHKKLIELNISNGSTEGKTVYTYNAKDELTRETYYKEDEEEPEAVTNYSYDANGRKIKEVFYDYSEQKNRPKYVYITRYEYW